MGGGEKTGLFRATQNTAFGIFIVETAESLRRRRFSEVKIDIEIEHQHLAVVLHNLKTSATLIFRSTLYISRQKALPLHRDFNIISF